MYSYFIIDKDTREREVKKNVSWCVNNTVPQINEHMNKFTSRCILRNIMD